MVKKTVWSVILVLVTTCSIFFARTGLFPSDASAAAVGGNDSTSSPIQAPVEPTATAIQYTPGVCITLAPPTATATVAPTSTATVKPTSTARPTSTPTAKPTATVQPTATSVIMTFEKQEGSPQFIRAFTHMNVDCNWQGYAGQVFDRNGKPLNNYIVKITGTYNGNNISVLGITGAVSGDPYGPGGYEIVLSNSIHQALQTLSIQLFNPKGAAISDPYLINTSAYCSKNLGIFNFVQK